MSALPHPSAESVPRPPHRPRRRAQRLRRRGLRVLAFAMILAGTLALADALVTLVWQEPLSALYGALRQDSLRATLGRIERAPPAAAARARLAGVADERHRIALLASELQRSSGEGSPVGRIVIPRIGASYVVVKGTGTEALESGPGIDTETPFPGIGGTTLIAGHRTTFLAPFRHIDELRPGSTIRLQMPYAEMTYAVVGQRVVAPTDVEAAVATVGYTRLVLSACTPLFSAAKRLLVFARLRTTVPRGAARLLPGAQLAQPIQAPLPGAPAVPAARKPLPPVLEPIDRHVIPPLV